MVVRENFSICLHSICYFILLFILWCLFTIQIGQNVKPKKFKVGLHANINSGIGLKPLYRHPPFGYLSYVNFNQTSYKSNDIAWIKDTYSFRTFQWWAMSIWSTTVAFAQFNNVLRQLPKIHFCFWISYITLDFFKHTSCPVPDIIYVHLKIYIYPQYLRSVELMIL